MEFFDNLFGRKKDKPVSKDEKKTFRDSCFVRTLRSFLRNPLSSSFFVP